MTFKQNIYFIYLDSMKRRFKMRIQVFWICNKKSSIYYVSYQLKTIKIFILMYKSEFILRCCYKLSFFKLH